MGRGLLMEAELFTKHALEQKIYPVFDLVEKRLEAGCEIKKTADGWVLQDKSGEHVTSGKTIRALMCNLIFTDC
jgi:hypothetical protein